MRAAQTRVVTAVLRGADYPEGFDPVRLDTAHDGILRKRAWAVAGAWPLLARALGPTYLDRFGEYVSRERPFQPADGSLLDGRWFAAHLARRGVLPDVGRVQAFSFDLHHRVVDEHVEHRTRPCLRLEWLRRPPYLLVGLRTRRVRAWRVPLSRRRMR